MKPEYILDLRQWPADSAQRTVRSTMFQIHAMELGARWPGPVRPFPESCHCVDAPTVGIVKENGLYWLYTEDHYTDGTITLGDFINKEVL